MNCMKCGKETEEDQIFCAECLALMEKYPVKPGVVVQIPVQPVKKQVHHHHRRPAHPPEEQVKRLTGWNRILTGLLLLMMAVSILLAGLAFDLIEHSEVTKLLGQNYSVVQQTEPQPQIVATNPTQ